LNSSSINFTAYKTDIAMSPPSQFLAAGVLVVVAVVALVAVVAVVAAVLWTLAQS
jgi:hypothetical protein